MSSIEIFLLDLNPSAVLGEQFKQVLMSSSFFFVRHSKQSLEEWLPSCFETSFSGILSQADPDLIIMVLSHFVADEYRQLLEKMSKKSIILPIMAVFESTSSLDTMILMLRSGSIIFIPSPLTAQKVLPVVWRLVANQ
ncbi:MAG: hypothetical protein RBS57_00655 [Desulforhabdus sp.]|jgi:hypothetical protein|nr:hypothetical protein [Desulforhabdus sp.]